MEKQIRGVVFDMDGLLLNTEHLTFTLCRTAASEMGFTLSLPLFKQTIGLRSSDTQKLYSAAFGNTFDFAVLRARNLSMFWSYIKENGVPVKKGVFELLSFLKNNKIRCAVATSTSRQTASKLLSMAGIAAYMDTFVYGDMVENGKPAPDIFLKACTLLSCKASACMGLEDSYNGIRAVHSAGMVPVMVPDMLPPTQETNALVHATVQDLTQVQAVIETYR